jgi:integrase
VFLARHAAGLRRARDVRLIIEHEFVKLWGNRPITDIQTIDVVVVIRSIVQRGAPYQAHAAFAHIRRLFRWAISTHEFGIDISPVERLDPGDMIGRRLVRKRVLKDAELKLVWEGAETLGFPYGPLFRLLILTGQREREVADLRWAEIDLKQRLWIIPSERMKNDGVHEVPLAGMAQALLERLPRFNDGDFVFTTMAGLKPVNGFSKAKARIDKASGVTDWRIHDIRRSVRTHFSALPIPDMIRELVIAHARPDLHRIYDQHSYRNEKRECLELWEARLRGILDISVF